MKRFKLFQIVIILGACVTLVLSGCSLLAPQVTATPQTTSQSSQKPVPMAEGRLMPRDSAWLSFNYSAKVAEVYVEEGQQVTSGTALARLGNLEEIEARLKAAEQAELEAQKALDRLEETTPLERAKAWSAQLIAQVALLDAQERLERLDTQAYQERIENAWDRVQRAKKNLEDAQAEFEKYKDLDEDNPTRVRAEDNLKNSQTQYNQAVREHARLVNTLDQARAALDQAQSAFDDVKKNYEELKNGPDPDTLAVYKARLANTQAQRLAAQAALDNMTLTAPYDGEITSVKISAGEPIIAGSPAIQIADFSEWYVETSDLNELEVVDIEVGQRVVIQPDALPGVELTGVVEHIASAYIEKNGDILYTVRIRLEETEKRLRWGMTVVVVFGQ